MNQTETYWTLQTAIQYGGGFIRQIAKAALIADADNKALIFKYWPQLESVYGPTGALYIGKDK
tara:strand:+ start:11141 stop:11329 length:189 start_codon:yes stop_codon:yes gene_type:complete